MTYELAKKLKEAGFHQEDKHGIPLWEICNQDGTTHDNAACDKAATPSLSELIEACGDDWSTLHKITNKPQPFANYYAAQSDVWEEQDGKMVCLRHGMVAYGDTKESAVANLWLALNGENEPVDDDCGCGCHSSDFAYRGGKGCVYCDASHDRITTAL